MASPDLIAEAALLFGNERRPEHFTNYRHCCECAEHDETLRNTTPDQLTYDDVSPGWDPLCFITPEGFRYYFPALVREYYTLAGWDPDTGRPLPETIKELGLEEMAKVLK